MRLLAKNVVKNQLILTVYGIFLLLIILNIRLLYANEHKFKVVTTFTIIQDIAQNVAGDVAIVEAITIPGAEIHEYEPTPKDLVKAQSADLILYNGLNLERWFERFFQDIQDVPSVIVTEGILPIAIKEGSYSGNPNPHAWMSPNEGLIYIENIRKALVRYDPVHTDIYNQNAANYRAKIIAIDQQLRQKFSTIPKQQRWLLTSEGAFSYLTRDYEFNEAYLWPINAEQQGTPKQVKKVIDFVKKYNIPVIFSESTISNKPAIQVSRETNIRYGGVLYVDSLSKQDGLVPTYIDLLTVTGNNIAKGFAL